MMMQPPRYASLKRYDSQLHSVSSYSGQQSQLNIDIVAGVRDRSSQYGLCEQFAAAVARLGYCLLIADLCRAR